MSTEYDFLNVFYGKNDWTNFTSQLFRLIAKADRDKINNLAKGFPVEVSLYDWWMIQEEMPSQEKVVKAYHILVEHFKKEKSDDNSNEGQRSKAEEVVRDGGDSA